MITFRNYQLDAINAIWNFFATKEGNPLVAMPTGTGKSLVIAGFLQSVLYNYPRQRIICLTHVKELIEQNYLELLNVWPNAPAGINSASLGKSDFLNPIVFAGIATVFKKWNLFGHIDLILIDEAHLLSPDDTTMYQSFIAGLKTVNPYIKVVGLTATPWRVGVGKITDGGLFTDVCIDMTTIEAFNWFIREGYLCPLIPKPTKTVLEIDNVAVRGGDYVAGELEKAINQDSLTENAVKEALELGHNRKHWLVFCSGINHTIRTAEILNMFGVDAIAVHSKMSKQQRDDAIKGAKLGKYRALVNNNILTTGFNFPAIDLILMLRPTMSTILWIQMLGRGTRPSIATQKENCLVLDYARNTRRLGPINDPVIPRKKGEKKGEAPVRECPVCETYNHASARFCIYCGEEFKVSIKLHTEASTEQLIKEDLPIVKEFKVDHITYSRHYKEGSKPSMKVSYHCGLKVFSEYVCFEHTDYAGRKARIWWKNRCKTDFPTSTEEGMQISSMLPQPTHLRVWVNKKYPEIMSVCFDGTMFGKQEDSGERAQLSVEKPKTTEPVDYDDDIPF